MGELTPQVGLALLRNTDNELSVPPVDVALVVGRRCQAGIGGGITPWVGLALLRNTDNELSVPPER